MLLHQPCVGNNDLHSSFLISELIFLVLSSMTAITAKCSAYLFLLSHAASLPPSIFSIFSQTERLVKGYTYPAAALQYLTADSTQAAITIVMHEVLQLCIRVVLANWFCLS